MTRDAVDLARFDLRSLVEGCVENLRAVYDERRGLFPYSTLLTGGRFASDYSHPQALRYTINTLLGLGEAAKANTAGVTEDEVAAMRDAFLEHQLSRLDTCADAGLLLLLLSEYGEPEIPAVSDLVASLQRRLTSGAVRRLNVQDLSWTMWGACAATRRGVRGSDKLAADAFDWVVSELLDPRLRLPRHTTERYRSGIVSFGGLVYFLRAMFEYASTFGSVAANDVFVEGVQHAINLQGPLGEWPWMVGVRSGRALDSYPVFSVHQDSMAMLFLLPAYDRSAARTKGAIERSLAWGFGGNELSIDFYPRHPFRAYRSIERLERAPRLRRFMRSRANALVGRRAAFGEGRVRLNLECRSYHLGWILYVWAGRPEARAGHASPPENSVIQET